MSPRFAVIAATSAEVFTCWAYAMARSRFQKWSSRLMLVRCPSMTIERLRMAEYWGCGIGLLGDGLSIVLWCLCSGVLWLGNFVLWSSLARESSYKKTM